ncbi:hypothetical protein SCD_n00488 [Sulfuricella denitrificans skB26]|uniref:PEP-CTERM protein-sorting domain-containing protein n=1 Tax=Sulfuricella denitrificans (strain DSM 22764 / NBRC 105220 / skB26) TaxID=1163617 RepID=S6AEU5_SULDS|nr:VPLPA-CTERM sorting domain-containing protein [Sulfuricella denitrificans]BAN34336.1 hypothetical protein SCD_n00488 [Sulfuricella denitrificans skB26]
MKNNPLFKTCLVAALVISGSVSTAQAATITFDNLDTSSGSYAQLQNGYAGFNWDNFWAVDGLNYYDPNDPTAIGYTTGVVSPNNVAFNGFADPASFSSTTIFSLESAYVTKARDAGLTHFDGYNGASLLYSMDVYSTTTAPTFVTFNWAGLDKVVMSDGDGTAHTAIDDITVNSVPVPAAAWLLGSGLLGLIGVARRKVA